MRWHQGPIPAAIGEAKQNNAVFVIYVEGEDDLSKSMTATWEDGTVKKACQEAGFVGMKLTANSEAYPVVCIPSTFFIGDNGVPLEVVGGSLPVNQFLERIQKVIQHQWSRPLHPLSYRNLHPPPPPSLSLYVQIALAAMQIILLSYMLSLDNTSNTDTTERMERAKRLIEERREAKRQEEIEEEKRKEQERRRQGQEMVKARQTTQERQAKARAEEIRKAKEEERLARERVREQIARDREERAARYKQEKEEREQAQLVREQERAAEEASRQAARSEFARLQFRLPDGSSVTNTFASSDSLETARQFVAESFAMATTFPRRQFTDADMASSLMDLGLAPSAALVVLPARSGASIVSSGGSGGIMDMVWLVLSPLAALWRFLHTFLFGTPQNPSRPANTPQPPPRQEQATFSNSPTGVSKREGNVIRFSPQQDPDDDQNTYNGNSTQQM
uniref:UBX domain-containing protein 4 n=1 Tax=Branchiostoma floridae TaxID=7739 RepID=C3XSN3_BRAFL|eukprot:XP_002612945.1 hypothetical protein BRAFLDRAFT_58187 [Branchiostoma floridae]